MQFFFKDPWKIHQDRPYHGPQNKTQKILKNIEIIQNMLSDFNGIKLKMNNKENRKISEYMEILKDIYKLFPLRKSQRK